MLNKSIPFTFSKLIFAFSTQSKRSYYQILSLPPSYTPKQLRRNYLIQARKYHPDHNDTPEAIEEFKLIKEAYEVLKDPQKKGMYDAGISETSEEVSPVYDSGPKVAKKYYENKWYKYTQKNKEDQREDYYQAKAQYFTEETTNPLKYVVSFAFVVVAVFGWDLLSRMTTEQNERNQAAKSVIDNSYDDSKLTKEQAIMRRYMSRKADANKVQL